MPRVSHQFVVDQPIGAVFDVVTTARFWPEWHPATRAVEGDIGHPALPSGDDPGNRIVVPARRRVSVATGPFARPAREAGRSMADPQRSRRIADAEQNLREAEAAART